MSGAWWALGVPRRSAASAVPDEIGHEQSS